MRWRRETDTTPQVFGFLLHSRRCSSLRQMQKEGKDQNQPIPQSWRGKAQPTPLPAFIKPSSCFHRGVFPPLTIFSCAGSSVFFIRYELWPPGADCAHLLWDATSTTGGSTQGSATGVVNVTHFSAGSGLPGVKQNQNHETRLYQLAGRLLNIPKLQNITLLEPCILLKVLLSPTPVTPVFHPLRGMPGVGKAAIRRQICLLCRFWHEKQQMSSTRSPKKPCKSQLFSLPQPARHISPLITSSDLSWFRVRKGMFANGASGVAAHRGLSASLATVPGISASPGHTFGRRKDDLSKGGT